MNKFIPTYKQTKTMVIKICLSCHHVEELPESTIDCPSCRLTNHLFYWDSPYKFQNYIERYKPKHLNVIGEHLQYIVDEALMGD